MRLFFRALLLLALAPACGLDKFDVHASGRTAVQGSVAGLALDAVPLQLDGLTGLNLSSSEEFKNKGVKPSDVDSIKLKSLSLVVESPSGATLDFLHHVDFFVDAPGQTTAKIASIDVPAGATHADAAVAGVELKPYATASSMTISSKVNGHQPSHDTTLRVDAVLGVDAALGPF